MTGRRHLLIYFFLFIIIIIIATWSTSFTSQTIHVHTNKTSVLPSSHPKCISRLCFCLAGAVASCHLKAPVDTWRHRGLLMRKEWYIGKLVSPFISFFFLHAYILSLIKIKLLLRKIWEQCDSSLSKSCTLLSSRSEKKKFSCQPRFFLFSFTLFLVYIFPTGIPNLTFPAGKIY